MLKVTILLGALIALTTAAVIPAADDNTGTTSPCLYPDQMWGSEDGTKFYFCLTGTEIVIENDCPEDTFFVRNSTVTGCVPLDAVDPHCVYLTEVGECTGKNLKQPQPSEQPTKFYFCPSEGATPDLLSCPDGQAFIKQNGYLRCFAWAEWRSLRNCPKNE